MLLEWLQEASLNIPYYSRYRSFRLPRDFDGLQIGRVSI